MASYWQRLRFSDKVRMAYLCQVGREVWYVALNMHLVKFSDIYPTGPMVSVSLFGQKMLIVNKHDIAFELLDKKSVKYSDRLVVPMAYDLVGWKHGLGMLCVGDRFRSHRKMFHQVIGTPATFEKHHPVVEHEMHQMLKKILERPLDFAKHIRRYVCQLQGVTWMLY